MRNEKLLMIPGPTPVVRSILDQMGRPTVAFSDSQFIDDFRMVVQEMRDLLNAQEALVVSGSGSLAMEMAIDNTLQAGERLLIVSNGFFGDRFMDVIRRRGIEAEVLQAEWGERVEVAEIQTKLTNGQFDALTITHVDTSTGVVAPVAEIGQLLAKEFPEMIYIVDGVSSVMAEAVDLEGMAIDVLISASQKAFGVPPGLAFLWLSQKALDKRRSLGDLADYYNDLENWLGVMRDPSQYFSTPPVNLIWALKEALVLIREEGLEARWARHRQDARAIQKALESLGFRLLAKEGIRSVSLSNVLYMEGLDDQEFRKVLEEEGVIVARGLGDYRGKMFRLAHMGNIDQHMIVATLAAIERTLYRLGIEVEFGQAVGTYLAAVTQNQ